MNRHQAEEVICRSQIIYAWVPTHGAWSNIHVSHEQALDWLDMICNAYTRERKDLNNLPVRLTDNGMVWLGYIEQIDGKQKKSLVDHFEELTDSQKTGLVGFIMVLVFIVLTVIKIIIP